MTARDELADLLYINVLAMASDAYAVADVILAAGYRKPRTISTVDEVVMLFNADDSAVLMDEDGVIFQSLAGGWASPSFEPVIYSRRLHQLFGPEFTVLRELLP